MSDVRMPPLDGELVVVDLSVGIAGGYCGKLLADGGAEIVKVEGPLGDPLRRRWLMGDAPTPAGADAPLFRHLLASTASVVGDPQSAEDREFVRRLIQSADAVIWAPGGAWADLPEFQPAAVREFAARAVVLAMTSFGLVSEPSYPANEFTLQSLAGGPVLRGRAD